MATGPWDNVQLPGPPNGPAYLGAAAQLMNSTGNAVNSAVNAYQQGQNFQYQQQLRNLFQNGFPQGANGQPDVNAISGQLIQSGGADYAKQLLPLLYDTQNQSQFYKTLSGLGGGGNSQPANTGPATNSSASGPENIHGNFSQGGPQPNLSATGGDTTAGGENIQTLTASIASGRGLGDVPQSKMQDFAKALGVGIDTPLSASQESIARKLIGANIGGGVQGGASPNRGGTNPVPQAGTDDQQITPSGIGGSSAVTPRQTGMRGQPLKVTVTPSQVAGDGASYGNGQTPLGDARKAEELEARAAQYYALSGAPRIAPAQAEAARKMGDSLHEQAKQIRETIQKYGSPEFNPAVKGQLSRFEGADKAVGEEIGQYRKSLQPARQMVNQLDIIDDAIKSAKGNLTTGPGAEAMVKIKQFVANVTGETVKGLREAEVIQKMNAYLASEAAKQLTNRPSQLEFKAFMANNPGIMNSVQGTQVLTDILRQTAKQTIGLGQLAGNRKNWDNWGDVESQYFQRNPIRMPFSGNQPGQPQGQTQGQTAPGRYQWSPQGGLQRVQ